MQQPFLSINVEVIKSPQDDGLYLSVST